MLPELLKRMPAYDWRYNSYFEPFLGGGALFFKIQPVNAFLSDASRELIITYKAIMHHTDDLIAILERYQAKHCEEFYYEIRQQYNDAMFLGPDDEVEMAASYIYLNKTAFNGLYRVNSRGEFNTPFGRYTNPKICDHENLRACKKALTRASVLCVDFSHHHVCAGAKRGDFVYLDPPYDSDDESGFSAYTAKKFGRLDQETLYDEFVKMDLRGANVMLSNADTTFIRDLYCEYNIEEIQAPRSVGGSPESRQTTTELIIRNY